MFDHLQEPFMPGTVIPSNRDPNGWHFTFRDATGNEYYYRVSDYSSAAEAKMSMRRFCAAFGNQELLDELYGPQ
jgi:hypothetical protein